MPRCRHGERGALVAEMAIAMPLILVVTLGLIDVARAMWAKHTVTHIAREGARFASVRSETSDDPATLDDIVERTVTSAVGIDTDLLEVVPTWGSANRTGNVVRVHVEYDFRPVTPLLPFDSIIVSSDSERLILY